jgi:soluble lytic murein transglycosylase
LCEWLSGLGDAAQAQAEGDAARAEPAARRALSARPRGDAAARASAALGIALVSRGAHEEGARRLELALAAPGGPAHRHLAFLRGEALLATDEPGRAADVFAGATAPAGLALVRPARRRRAEALLLAGRAGEAVPILEDLVREGPDDAAARLSLARALRAAEELARAAEVYRALWLELPETPESAAAAAALAAWRSEGGPIPPVAAAEEVQRAERLLASGWPERALAALDAAAAAEPPHAPDRAEVLRAGALVALGRHAEAERLAAGLGAPADEAVRRGALLVRARAAARRGDVEDASRLYRDVAALRAPVPGLPEWRQRELSDEAAFLSAWLFHDAGRFARAATLLDRFAKQNRRSPRADDALWFAAWSRYRLGRAAEADRAFARLARTAYADAALYWRARLAPSPAAAKELYRGAVRLSGDGWYALLARARLGALGEGAPRVPTPDARPFPEALDPAAAARTEVAVALLTLGLRDEALAELTLLSRSPRVRPSAAAVAQLAAFAGDAEIPFRMARDHLARTRRTVRWSHPRPYPELVEGRARAFGVDASLLLAVMRRESSFRPAVRSGAGAEGLLQLRPATALRLAQLLGAPTALAGRLAEPGVNVSFGAHYLGLLASRFGDPAVALAAYNAGPRPAAEWATARAGMPLDAWVESIPYRETRNYLKIVLADWDVYRALAGEAAAPLDPARKIAAPAAGVGF